MSVVHPSVVYTGFWTDHSLGSSVLGATLTVTSSTANILIAFIASFVSFAGLQLWDLVAFIYYLARVRDGNSVSDGLFHQQQILLRNIPSPGALAIRFGKLAWGWRMVDGRAWAKCLLPMSLALVISVGFVVAGIFSSQVFTSDNLDILVSSDACGWWNDTELDFKYLAQSLSSGIQFAKTCYNSTGTFNPACEVYVQDTPPLANVSHTSCPFMNVENMCPYASALAMDTGLLSSQSFFGVNSKASERIQFREVTTCAPIKTEGYFVEVNAEDEVDRLREAWGRGPFPGEKLIMFNYGPFLNNGKSRDDNTTFLKTSYYNANRAYTVGYEYAHGGPGLEDSSFQPIPELQVSDADLGIIFISGNSVLYQYETDDPIFSAHQPLEITSSAGPSQRFTADKPAGVLGCTLQYQFCNPTNDKCTSLTYRNGAVTEASTMLGLNPQQNTTLSLFPPNIVDVTDTLSACSLVAAETARYVEQPPIQSNQWEIEVQTLMLAAIATQQKFMSDYAIGANVSNPNIGMVSIAPATPEEEQLCGSQKMKAPTGFTNINVFGLGFTMGICSLIILGNQLVPSLLLAFWRRKKLQSFRVACWTQDGVLQTQRSAFENVDTSAKWQKLENDVPVTSERYEFPHLFLHKSDLSRTNTVRTNSGLSSSEILYSKGSSLDKGAESERKMV